MLEFNSVETLIGCVTVLLTFYYYNVWRYSYWRRKNVPGPKPVPIFGNFLDIISYKTSHAEKYRDLYQTWKHKPFVGLYRGTSPILVINDLKLLKHVLIKDFTTFTDRGFTFNEDADPLTSHLFFLEGHRWRGLRNKMSPAFTSGKLRQMYYLLCECADHFEKYVNDLVDKGEPIECKEITAKFTTDVIGSCAFGLDMKALSNEDSEFRNMGRKLATQSFDESIRRIVRDVTPGLFKFFRLRLIPSEFTEFFVRSIAETVAYRKQNDVFRHDFVDLLMQIQKNSDTTGFELTDKLLAAQAFVFFLAGFETSATTISYALYELAQNQDIQEKLRVEIQNALETHNGQLPYEEIKALKYLDHVVQETLRKHPPIPFLVRKSVKEYIIPDTDVHIPVGTNLIIPVFGLHYDEKYHPNPKVFKPERFDSANIQDMPQMAYLPFGDGPRNCIGARFATYQTKMGIIKILKNHRVSTSSKTQIPYVIDKHSFFLTSVGGIYLNFTKIV